MATRTSGRWWALGATALTLLVVGLDMTILNVALPDIGRDLDAGTSALQWFADAYLLVLAAVMLPAGMIGDRFGRKRLTLGALAVFGAGSAWCAWADSASSLIAARVVLGVGAAVLVPLAMSAVVVLFEPAERPRAVLMMSLATMVGLPLGPIAGGLLLQHFWWGSVFAVNIPVIVAAFVAVLVFLPADTVAAARGRIDVPGVLGSAVGLFGVTFAVIEGPVRGWDDPLVLVSLVAGLLVLAAFLAWERRLRGTVPVFDFAIWADRRFRSGAIAAAVASLALFGVMFTLPQFLRVVLGADALGTGLRTLPLVLGMLLAMQLAQRLGRVVPGRWLAAGGFALAAIGLAVGAGTSAGDGFLRTAIWCAVVGLGLGAALFAAQSTALVSLPRERAASGSALIQTLRQVGSVLGIAVLGAALSARYAGVGDSVEHFVSGMDLALWISAGVGLVGALVAALTLGSAGAESEGAESVDAARAA
jgi:MFS transporter, DHA2 family, multidrug resistance protein